MQETTEAGEFTDEQHSQIRKITAKRLLESKQTIPHYYLTIDCRVDRLLQLRKQLNEQLASGSSGAKLSVNDFVVKAAALVRFLSFQRTRVKPMVWSSATRTQAHACKAAWPCWIKHHVTHQREILKRNFAYASSANDFIVKAAAEESFHYWESHLQSE